jgi:hypothetical protein
MEVIFMRVFLKDKRADALAFRLFKKYKFMSESERTKYEKRIFEPRQKKLWNKAYEHTGSEEFEIREKGYMLFELYYKREMAWNCCQYLLVAEDWLMDVRNELKKLGRELKSDLKDAWEEFKSQLKE